MGQIIFFSIQKKYDNISYVFFYIKNLNRKLKSLCMHLIKKIENYLSKQKILWSSILNQPKLTSQTHNSGHELDQVEHFFIEFFV